MSGGPIRSAREAWKPPVVSTTAKDRVCMAVEGRAYCGRSSAPRVDSWEKVTCSDCHAARRADEQEQRRLDAVGAEHRAEWES